MNYSGKNILENAIILIILSTFYLFFKYKNISIDYFVVIFITGLLVFIKETFKNEKIYNTALQDLAGITATHTVFNIKLPGSNNIIDMITIHPTGIYLINKIRYEGHIRGTLAMDYWEIDDHNGKTYKIKNPIKEMKENESIAKTMIKENIYPVIIFKNKISCYVFDDWINESLTLLKEYEQEKIFKDKEYIITYTRAEDIFENMKQFQSKKRRHWQIKNISYNIIKRNG